MMQVPGDRIAIAMPVENEIARAQTPLQTIGLIAILIPIIAGYIFLGISIGLQSLFGGFLFATYWGAVKKSDITEFVPTLVGGLTGIAIAYQLYVLPLMFGKAGLVVGVILSIVPLYPLMRNKVQLFLNPAFIVFLTVATIPAIAAQHDYLGMATGTIFGAAYSRIILYIVTSISAHFSGNR
jgi:hypothetical protein